jgi:hypothetical protein
MVLGTFARNFEKVLRNAGTESEFAWQNSKIPDRKRKPEKQKLPSHVIGTGAVAEACSDLWQELPANFSAGVSS